MHQADTQSSVDDSACVCVCVHAGVCVSHLSCEGGGSSDTRRPQEIVPPDARRHLTDTNSMKEATHAEDYPPIIQREAVQC